MVSIMKFLEKYFSKTRVRILICLILMAVGMSNSEIKDKLGLDYKSLKKYRNALENEEIERLFSNGGRRRKSELEPYSEVIKKEFEEKPPATLREANERIKQLTGKSLSLNRLGIYLKKRG